MSGGILRIRDEPLKITRRGSNERAAGFVGKPIFQDPFQFTSLLREVLLNSDSSTLPPRLFDCTTYAS
jgi:hypothetical protein